MDYNYILNQIFERVYTNGIRFDGKIPTSTTDVTGKYHLSGGGGWTDSFFVGMLYLAYAVTKDEKYIAIANKYQNFFKNRAINDPNWCEINNAIPLDHDTGFIFSLSQVRRYNLLNDEAAKNTALQAARVLIGRFHEKGQFIRAWDTWKWDNDPKFIEEKKGKMIIDSMMNISLLYWASRILGDDTFKNIATAHANTVAKHIVRDDYSTYHQFNFDPATGEPKNGCTGQGYADESTWSRGQSWAIYGFSQTYLNTKDKKYLDIAKNCAYYFIDHLTPSGLPLWDFACEGKPFRPFDASAAAIALSGMVNLKYSLNDNDDKINKGIETILNGLLQNCSALHIDGWESVLLHACVGPAYHEDNDLLLINPTVDGPIIYADYYFCEALVKLSNPDKYIELLR